MTARLPLRLSRWLYSLALYLLLPLILYHLVWRGFRYRDYLRRWPERFGFFRPPPPRPLIWVHAVSVGEVNAAAPLVRALAERYPDHALALTCFTPTGSQRIRALWGERVFHVYAPYDLPDAVNRFFDRLRPALAVIMETELWPNLYLACTARGVPLVIANARLSARSLAGYWPVRQIMGRIVTQAQVVCAQSAADARRLVALGADPARVHEVGNLKYDLTLPPGLAETARHWRCDWGNRPVWIAASTHPGEEAAVLAAHRSVRGVHPDALLLWAPRHPERFAPVLAQARAQGWRVRRRSHERRPDAECACFVIDSLGELLSFYAAADVAFVGGSLVAVGGHNPLEPAALAVPVVVGPYTFNFAEICAGLRDAGALALARDAGALASLILELLSDPARREAMGRAGADLVAAGRGAAVRTLALIETCYPGRAHDPLAERPA